MTIRSFGDFSFLFSSKKVNKSSGNWWFFDLIIFVLHFKQMPSLNC